MCTPSLRARLAAAPGAASTNPRDAAAPPARNLGVTLAAFPDAGARSPLQSGATVVQPGVTNDFAAMQRSPTPSRAAPDRAPVSPAGRDRLDAIMRQIQRDQSQPGGTGPSPAPVAGPINTPRPVPSPPAPTPGGDASLDAIMQKIRREQTSARGTVGQSTASPAPPRAPAATGPKRPAPVRPPAIPKAASVGATPALQRRWPVPGYNGAADGTTSKAGKRGPNGHFFSGDGGFDPTGAKGLRHGRRHEGDDLPALPGDPVHAAADGVVVYVQPQLGPQRYWTKDKNGNPVHAFRMQPKRDKAGNLVHDRHGNQVMEHVMGLAGYGNRVWIDHPDGTRTSYNHLQSPSPLAVGARVRAGQVIGKVGTTGNAAGGGSHLHFEVRRYDRATRRYVPIDPAGWISGKP